MWKIEEVRIENNKVKITGTIINDFQFSHEAHGEKFYTSLIASKRASARFILLFMFKSPSLSVYSPLPGGEPGERLTRFANIIRLFDP